MDIFRLLHTSLCAWHAKWAHVPGHFWAIGPLGYIRLVQHCGSAESSPKILGLYSPSMNGLNDHYTERTCQKV